MKTLVMRRERTSPDGVSTSALIVTGHVPPEHSALSPKTLFVVLRATPRAVSFSPDRCFEARAPRREWPGPDTSEFGDCLVREAT